MEPQFAALRASIRQLSDPGSVAVVQRTLRQYPVLARFAVRELVSIASSGASSWGADAHVAPALSAVVAVLLSVGDAEYVAQQVTERLPEALFLRLIVHTAVSTTSALAFEDKLYLVHRALRSSMGVHCRCSASDISSGASSVSSPSLAVVSAMLEHVTNDLHGWANVRTTFAARSNGTSAPPVVRLADQFASLCASFCSRCAGVPRDAVTPAPSLVESTALSATERVASQAHEVAGLLQAAIDATGSTGTMETEDTSTRREFAQHRSIAEDGHHGAFVARVPHGGADTASSSDTVPLVIVAQSARELCASAGGDPGRCWGQGSTASPVRRRRFIGKGREVPHDDACEVCVLFGELSRGCAENGQVRIRDLARHAALRFQRRGLPEERRSTGQIGSSSSARVLGGAAYARSCAGEESRTSRGTSLSAAAAAGAGGADAGADLGDGVGDFVGVGESLGAGPGIVTSSGGQIGGGRDGYGHVMGGEVMGGGAGYSDSRAPWSDRSRDGRQSTPLPSDPPAVHPAVQLFVRSCLHGGFDDVLGVAGKALADLQRQQVTVGTFKGLGAAGGTMFSGSMPYTCSSSSSSSSGGSTKASAREPLYCGYFRGGLAVLALGCTLALACSCLTWYLDHNVPPLVEYHGYRVPPHRQQGGPQPVAPRPVDWYSAEDGRDMQGRWSKEAGSMGAEPEYFALPTAEEFTRRFVLRRKPVAVHALNAPLRVAY